MFSPSTTRRPNKRSLRELLRAAVDTALEFATLGEATVSAPQVRHPEPPAAVASHPHRRPASRRPRARRPGVAAPRAQPCSSPVAARRLPARAAAGARQG